MRSAVMSSSRSTSIATAARRTCASRSPSPPDSRTTRSFAPSGAGASVLASRTASSRRATTSRCGSTSGTCPMSRPKGPSDRGALALVASLSIAWPAAALTQPEVPPNLADLVETAPVEPEGGGADADPLRRARDALLAAGDASAALRPAQDLVAQPDAVSGPRYADD